MSKKKVEELNLETTVKIETDQHIEDQEILLQDLYKDHVIKEEMVLGPDIIQEPPVSFAPFTEDPAFSDNSKVLDIYGTSKFVVYLKNTSPIVAQNCIPPCKSLKTLESKNNLKIPNDKELSACVNTLNKCFAGAPNNTSLKTVPSFLNKALKDHVTEPKNQLYKCQISSNQLTCKLLLKQYQLNNSEVYYICDICNKKFRSKCDLELHMIQSPGHMLKKQEHKGNFKLKHKSNLQPEHKRNKQPSICKGNIQILKPQQILKKTPVVYYRDIFQSTNLARKSLSPCKSWKTSINKNNLKGPPTFQELHSCVNILHESLSSVPGKCSLEKFSSDFDKAIKSRINVPKKQLYNCQICNNEFSTKLLLKQHKVSHTKVYYICDICNRKFTSKCDLEVHMIQLPGHIPKKQEHKSNFKQSSICKSNIQSLLSQYMLLNKTFICDICNKHFLNKNRLRIHLKTHLNSKCFKCSICSKEFALKDYLEKHKTHQHGKTRNKRPHKCNICNKAYKKKHHLTQHLLLHTDIHHTCEICGKKLKYKFNYKRHLFSHENLDNTCHICKKAFVEKYSLKRHLSTVHGGDRNYKCDLCNKCYATKYHLTRHRATHTDVFKCDLCNKEVHRKDHMESHLKSCFPNLKKGKKGVCKKKSKIKRNKREYF